MIYLNDPELVKQVFTGDPTLFHAGEVGAMVLGPGVGPNSVLTLDEQPHMRQRKLLLPQFHGENVRRWGTTIREITERDMETWPVARPFSLRSHTQRITLEVILRAVFGLRGRERFDRAWPLVDRFARRANLCCCYLRSGGTSVLGVRGRVSNALAPHWMSSCTRRSRSGAGKRTSPSATCSRCCFRPRTRMGGR
jgi:cytochrome P450